jgi:hypothetical protein
MNTQEIIKEILSIQGRMTKDITNKALQYIPNIEDKNKFVTDCIIIAKYHYTQADILEEKVIQDVIKNNNDVFKNDNDVM